MTYTIIAGLVVLAIAGLARWLWARTRDRRGRVHRVITLSMSDEARELPFDYALMRIREGGDDAPLLNRPQRFNTTSDTQRETRVSYPRSTGLQFKCYADWNDTSRPVLPVADVYRSFEHNGWRDVSADGDQKGRFWFILPDFQTRNTGDVDSYRNNWLPAAPEPK